MNLRIDYPTEQEIDEQRQIVMQRAFLKHTHRPTPRTVFYQCHMSAIISLLIYFCLLFICANVRPDASTGGFIALAIFPVTYFSFYFLSILSEEQSEVIDLKMSLCYSFSYLVSLRMLYASIAAVGLNILLLIGFFRKVENLWSIGAAGTTSMLLLALISLVTYERTSSAKLSAVIITLWIVGCLLLMEYGTPLYHLLIEVVPLAVHITVAMVILGVFIGYIGKVERQNAYGF